MIFRDRVLIKNSIAIDKHEGIHYQKYLKKCYPN